MVWGDAVQVRSGADTLFGPSRIPMTELFTSVLVVMVGDGGFVLPITIYVSSAIASTGAIYMF